MYKYICHNCGKNFESKHKNKKYCSRSCYFKTPKSDEFKTNCSKRCSGKGNPMYGTHRYGKENPFYGKTHTKETRQRISEEHKNNHDFYSNRVKGKNNPMYGCDMSGKNNGMYGKHVSNEIKQMLSKRFSGKGNPMYGKPSPQGSGNGWSGWYKEKYFRSILELSCMVYFEENNIIFELAEKMRIPYRFLDRERTYSPDFYLPEINTVIECKYDKLVNSKQNKAKFNSAIKYFENFKIITEKDITILDCNKIKDLYNTKLLIWNSLYEKKFKETYF